jgi:hypothetical protein
MLQKCCKNKEKFKNMGFWGCSCKFEVDDHDTETYSVKHMDKKNSNESALS